MDIDGLRHIIEPSVNYVYVPTPSTPPSQLPQFDSELPSLLLLPIEFPDYNDIDSIDSENVIRFGLRNTLQTKRDGQLDKLLDWNVTAGLAAAIRAATRTSSTNRQPAADFQRPLFRPRVPAALVAHAGIAKSRYDINAGDLNMAFHQLTFTPNERWSWGIGHWYLRSGFDGSRRAAISSPARCFIRLNDNWGFRDGA